MAKLKLIDHLIGHKIGHWTLLEDLGRIYSRRIVKVRCVCNFEKYIDYAEIKRGKSTNCGCQVRNNPKSWLGKKVNRLTIIEILGTENGKTRVKCICECGVQAVIRFDSLMNSSTKSCGCLHGESVNQQEESWHLIYIIWAGMRTRCNTKHAKAYKNYGAIGVEICPEWDEFIPFYNWCRANGWKKGLQIDKDILSTEIPGKIYSPSTCCFVTRKQNMNRTTKNVFLEYNGDRLTMSQWSEKMNISYQLLAGRIKSGWSIEDAIEKPLDKKYSKYYRK